MLIWLIKNILYLYYYLFFNVKFLIFYVTLNLICSFFLYSSLKKYYEPTIITREDGKQQDLNDMYPEFKRYESKKTFNFSRIFFGFMFLVWIKLFIFLNCCIWFYIALKIVLRERKMDAPLTHGQRTIAENIAFVILSIVAWDFGIFYKEKKIVDHDVFRKYLGNNYEDRKDYSVIISNHTSYIDIFVYFKKFAPAFVSKASIYNVPLIGFICASFEGLFVERESKEKAGLVAKQMYDRQTDFMKKKILTPLLVFPEGTVSSGRHMLIFRAGAFEHQLPVKPYVLVYNDGDDFSFCTGGLSQGLHFLYTFCFLYNSNLTILELPTIYPTEFMFEKHSEGIENKTHVFANVTRKIMAEVAGLELSNKTLKHAKEFDDLIMGKNSNAKKKPSLF